MPHQVTLADYFSEHASSSRSVYEIETKNKKNHKLILESSKKIAAGLENNIGKNKMITGILPNSLNI